MSHESSPEREMRDLRAEAWGIGRSVSDLREEVLQSSLALPNREQILKRLREIAVLIPDWTEADEDRERVARKKHGEQQKRSVARFLADQKGE